MNNDTTITYERVEAEAETIRGCSANMKSIFDDFSSTRNNIFSSGMFEGQASQTFNNEYNDLRGRFDSYTSLVEQFASSISSANQDVRATEQSIAKDAEALQFGSNAN